MAIEQDRSSSMPQTDDRTEGSLVLQEVVQLTGLPEAYVDAEIGTLLGTPDKTVNNMTLDQLRIIMLNYLETMNESMTAQIEEQMKADPQELDIPEKENSSLTSHSRH